MNIQITSIHFTADHKLTEFIQTKVEKLDQYFDRIVRADVILKLENSGQVRDKIVEIRLKVPQDTLIVKESNKTFESATDSAIDNIKRQIKRYKEKMSPRHS